MRLPDIQYGATPGVSNAPTPQQAVAASAQKMNILQKAQTAADEIATDYREFNVTKADAAYADEMSQFRKEAAKLDVLSPGEVAALDLDIDTEGKSEITKDVWYPKLLAKRMDEYRGKHASTITSPVDRQRWLGEVSRNDNKILEKEIEVAAAETRAFRNQQLVGAFNEAEEKGDFATMQMIIADPSMDNSAASLRVKNQLQSKYETAEKNQAIEDYEVEVNQIVETGSDADLDKLYERLTDPEKRAKYPGGERGARVLTNRVQAEQDRRLRNAAIAGAEGEKQRNAIAKDAVTDLQAAQESGMEVYDYQMDEVRAKVEGTDYAESFQVFENARTYSAGTYEQRQAEKDAMQSQGLDGAQQYKAYISEDLRIQKGLEKGGYQFAVQESGARFIPLNSPESVRERKEQVSWLSETMYGTPDNPAQIDLLGPAEADQLSSQINNNTPDENLVYMGIFQNTPEIFGQLVDSGAGVFAVSASTGNAQIALDAMNGQRAIDSGKVKLPTKAEYGIVATDHLGTFYKNVPETQAAIMDTALAMYANAAPFGDEGVFDQDLFEAQLNRVAPIGEVNGTVIPIPQQTSEDSFQLHVDHIDPGYITQLGGAMNKTPEAAALMAREGDWLPSGNDKYHVVMGNEIMLSAETGEPLEFLFDASVANSAMADEWVRKNSGKQPDIPSMPGF